MDQRHQVFVSSTYIDLIQERNEVMQALLELECMPAGMELFPAANDSQWNWIKKVIDESDYYIVISAGRYGTVSRETGQSFTEMEYCYALDKGKPVIGFLHEDPFGLPAKFVEQSPATRKKLELFRTLIKSKLCKFYSSPADLGAKVSRSLTQLRKQHPATGWVRADILDKLASSDDVLQLMRENEELKERLYRLGLEKPATENTLASGREQLKIDFCYSRNGLNAETKRFRKINEEWSNVAVSWDDMFAAIAPDMLKNPRYSDPSNSLSAIIEQKSHEHLQRKHIGQKFDNFRISSRSYDTILLQFRAIKLLTVDGEGQWKLTPYGDNYMTKLLAVPKGKKK